MCAGPDAGAGTARRPAPGCAHTGRCPERGHRATELALRLAAALGAPGGGLGGFWASRGYLTEGRVWLAEALALPHRAPPDARAAALLAAGGLAAHQGDNAQALALLEAGVALWRRTGDAPATARALLRLATFLQPTGEPARVHELAAEALAAFRDRSDAGGTADCLRLLGASTAALGDVDGGEGLLRQALRLYQRAHDQRGVGVALCQLGSIAHHQRGDFAAAQRLLEQGLDALRAAGAPWWVGIWLNILGLTLRGQGEYERAAACYAESLALRRELRMAGRMLFPPLVNLGFASLRLRDHTRAAAAFAELLTIGQALSDAAAVGAPPPGPARVAATCVGLALLGLAGVAAARGAARDAARLLGKADDVLAPSRDRLDPLTRAETDWVAQGVTEALRRGLTADQRDRLLAEGRAMSAEAAAEVARAVGDAGVVGGPPLRSGRARDGTHHQPTRAGRTSAAGGGAAGDRSG